MDSVRLSLYCVDGEPGYHMPYLRAAEDGLFERYGLDVELLEQAPGGANVLRVADGGADFCLTSVAYFVKARAQRPDVPARFAAVITQRHPMAAVVLEDSPIAAIEDLPRARVGGHGHGGLVSEYLGALAHLGIARPEVVADVSYDDAPAALRDRTIDVMGDFVDLQPKLRHIAGPVRALPFGIDVYANGLVAADRLPLELVERMRTAVCEALTQHAAEPELAVDAMVARYPNTNPDDAIEGWHLIEPLIFTDRALGAMTEDGWQRSLQYAAGVHNVPVPATETAYRPEMLEVPQPA